MSIKTSVAGLVVAASMFVAVGPIQATPCFYEQPGWHMVSKRCNIVPAESWQEYASGVYLQPMSGRGMPLMGH